MNNWNKMLTLLLAVLLTVSCVIGFSGCSVNFAAVNPTVEAPEYTGDAYVVLNDNQPEFTEDQLTVKAYEHYSDLDYLGRCGYAMACVGVEIMPVEPRGSIGQVKPTGWQTVKYDFVDGKYLYNRCHLIGFQLTGENANEKNLITGTRCLNVEGMLPFENMIADYVKETENHVLYRVTPVFEGTELVARGVQMEAYSVEDNGDGVCFNVYVYNQQPYVTIDYSTGESELSPEYKQSGNAVSYILNINSKKFHKDTCGQAQEISQANRQEYTGDREVLIATGYVPAGCCKP